MPRSLCAVHLFAFSISNEVCNVLHVCLPVCGCAAPSFVALGLLQERVRDLKGAEQLYHKALHAYPHNVPVRDINSSIIITPRPLGPLTPFLPPPILSQANLHLGRLCERRGSLSLALDHYRAALTAQPTNLFGLVHTAMVYEARRQPSDPHDAEKYYRQVRRPSILP